MKKILTVVLVVFMALGLVACGGNNNNEQTGPVEITLWHTYTDHHNDYINGVAEKFNAAQNEVKLVVVQQPLQDYDANLLQAIRNGVGPDVVSRYCSNIPDYIDEGLLVDFAPYINDKKNGIPNFKENLVGSVYGEISQWGEDAIYAIPCIVTSEVLYYNKTLFDQLKLEVPTTWAELETVSKAIYAATGKPGFATDGAVDTYTDMLLQAGSNYINPETKSMEIDETIGLEKLNYLAGGIKEGYFRLAGDDYYCSGPFTSGAVASYAGSSAGVAFATANGGAFEVGCAPIPQDDRENNPFIPSFGGGYVGIKSTPEKEEAVYKFLKWFTTAENCADWAIQFGALPAYKDALEVQAFQDFAATNIAVKALYESADCVGWYYSPKGAASVRTLVNTMVAEAAVTTSTMKEVYDNAIAACNRELNQ